MTLTCQHRRDTTAPATTAFGAEPQWVCGHHAHDNATLAQCVVCPDYMRYTATLTDHAAESALPLPPLNRHPAGVVVDRYGKEAGVADLYKGCSAFAVFGGPSVNQIDLSLLGQRGIIIFSCNNNVAVLPKGIRPHVWTFTDPATKFHIDIFRDPAILKFIPLKEADCRRRKQCLRRKVDGKFTTLEGVTPRDMPGTFYYHRNTEFNPENFLWESTWNRGNSKKSPTAKTWGGTINSMFTMLRMAFYLGVKRLYLVGCDFHMVPEQPYAFRQGKSAGGCKSNNAAFADMILCFDALKPYFDAAGFEVVNCNPSSALWTFPFVEFEAAVKEVASTFEQWPLDCANFYDKDDGDRGTS